MNLKLNTLLEGIEVIEMTGNPSSPIQGLTFDSREVASNFVFVAVKGVVADGHDYIEMAIKKGASVIIAEQFPFEMNAVMALENRVFIQVENSQLALGKLAANFYGHPSKELKLVGITGTNGKTTTATLLHDLFTNLGYKVGLVSTIENRIGVMVSPATHTTPDVVKLNRLLRSMVEEGCYYVFMEVSSHAIHQKRIQEVVYAGGIFTNITHEHLDYHNTFKEYINVKKAFFDGLPKNAFALSNRDDRRGEVMLQNSDAKRYFYSLKSMADFKAKVIDNSLSGLLMEIGNYEFHSRMIGDFNAYNILSVYACALLLEQDEMEVLTVLSKLKPAEGRFDYIIEGGIMGIVDYAHTPDALEKVLQTINKLKGGSGSIITIVGCGGDRDDKKRPKMAKIACDYSQQVLLTSDNPRTEDPYQILKDMEGGIPPYASGRAITIPDRKQAIKSAVFSAKNGDVILVAGKGHEKYQEIKGVRTPFDDKAILKNLLKDKVSSPKSMK